MKEEDECNFSRRAVLLDRRIQKLHGLTGETTLHFAYMFCAVRDVRIQKVTEG